MLEDYEEVPDRIRRFFKDNKDGRLARVEWHVRDVKEQTFIVYTAAAYRSADDPDPGIGTAWEPFPGKTSFTRDSELMNAETSAWGRALVALGYVAKKVASAEEVRNRQGDEKPKPKVKATTKPSEKQIKFLGQLVRKNVKDGRQLEQMFAEMERPDIVIKEGWSEDLTAGEVSALIDRLNNGEFPPPPEPLATPDTDAPADDAAFVAPKEDVTLEDLVLRENS